MTINLTFNDYEEMETFCGAIVAKNAIQETKTAEAPAKKKPAKKVEEAKVPEEELPWSISIEEVRKAAGEYIKSHGKDALLDVLKEWNAKNITALAEEHYAAFMKKVGE